MGRNIRELQFVLDGNMGSGLRSAIADTTRQLSQIDSRMRQLEKGKVSATQFTALQAESKGTAISLAKAQAEVAKISHEMKATKAPSDQMRTALETAKVAAAGLKSKMAAENRELRVLEKNMRGAGISSKSMASDMKRVDVDLSKAGHESNSLRKKLSGLEKQEERTGRAGRGMGGGILGGLSGLAKGALGAAAVYVGFNELKGAYTSLTGAAIEDLRAQQRLSTLMLNVPGTTKANVAAISKYSYALQQQTTIQDDVSMAGASQLSTFRLQGKYIKQLMPAMTDLAVGQYGVNVSQEQMIKTGNLVGKVYTGQVGALRRYGISFSKAEEKVMKHGSQAQKTAMLVRVLKENYGGLAKSMAQTDEGRAVQVANTFGDMKEKLGGALLPIQSEVLKLALKYMPLVETAVDKIVGAIPAVKTGFASTFKEIYTILKPVIGFIANQLLPFIRSVATGLVETFAKAWPKIRPALASLVDSIGGLLKSIMPVLKFLWNILKPIVGFLLSTVVPAVLKVASWIIGALSKIITYLVDVRGWWGKIKDAAVAVWNWLARFFTDGPGQFIPIVAAIRLVVNNWDKIKEAAIKVWDWLKIFYASAKAKLQPVIDAVKYIADNWGKVTESAKKAYDWIVKIGKYSNPVLAAYNIAKSATGSSNPKTKSPAKHARGGIVGRPTLSWVGEQGREAIIPLDNNGQRARSLWNETGRLLGTSPALAGAGSGGIVINASIPVTINGNASSADVEAGINRGLDSLRRQLEQLVRDNTRRSMS